MAESDVRDVYLRLDRPEVRVGLVVVALVAAGATLLWVRAGHRVVQLSSALDGANLTAALEYVPDHPLVHRRLGLLSLYDPLTLEPLRAVDHFRRAARGNPFDFQSWMLLGQALETAGQGEAAERAYRKALERAPRYFLPRWLYANFLLRQGANARALAAFEQAVEANPPAAEIFSDMIWQSSSAAPHDLVQAALRLRSPEAREIITGYLIARGETDEALRLWENLTWDASGMERLTRSLVAELMRQKQFGRAARVWHDGMKRKGYAVSDGDERFWNGGFEYGLAPVTSEPGFDWCVRSTSDVKTDIVESGASAGRRALKLTFLAREQVTFAGVSHSLALSPATAYRLRFRYRTKEMVAPTGLLVEIARGFGDGALSLLTRSRPLGPSANWAEVCLPFETPATDDLITVRIVRRPIGPLYDYISGSVWFDEFTVEPVSSAHSACDDLSGEGSRLDQRGDVR
ncbi:MAG TPA: tetratricopeptide repeat protein [Blastocatellia bacterium]|nr:tetratricopeptide repeat protein [Blastocatellia bacterium]